MSDLYDETPGKLVVFIRYNPHTYKPPDGVAKLKPGEERRKVLLDTINKVIDTREVLRKKSLLHTIYICYSEDNERIARNIPKTLIFK